MDYKKCLMNIQILGKNVFRNYLVKKEGGEQYSATLRKYTKEKYRVSVGLYTYGCCFNPFFNLGGTVNIGRYCSFATDVHYFGANHPVDHVSTSPFFYNPVFGFNVKDVPRETLTIGHDVWCGYGVIITSKCHIIGNGAVIAAGSIVTRDIPPYAIVKGSPARIYKYRFDKETIDLLEQSQWYNLTPEEIMVYCDDIKEPRLFAKKILSKYTGLVGGTE